jgi:hypothetical protein
MRINTTRLGLIVLLIGVILLSSVCTATVLQNRKTQIGVVEPGATFAYGLFMAPLGLGNLWIEGDTMVAPPASQYELDHPNADGSIHVNADPIRVEYEMFVHLVVVSPSGVTLVDEEGSTPYFVPVDFDERGEYVVYVTNLGNETGPIPVSVKFPPNSGVVYREADKFLVSIILTASGAALLCIGLSTTLITKHKKPLPKNN